VLHWNTELLAERYRGKLDERADKYIGYAVDGARRMQRLILDLLAYARVSSQAKSLQPTDTAVLLASVVAMMSKTIESSKAEIVSENLPMVSADEMQLGQVFQNLLGNALKFHGERAPRIQVRAETIENGNTWRFSVADNGIGIDKENGGRLFQMFQRLHTREEYEGTGIGLAISKRIVERHAGRIWFDSAPGQGTTFYFTLPRPERCAV
jgi:light-regulated signal transduction histidine kinase (bacteriophytochrome)